ncbi:MAG TPA: nucleoside 2-deoxyribosyltransferase [Candidatus Paceibacterota bacterium]
MKFNDMKVYIAAPFFNAEQLRAVEGIETALESAGVKFFSPRSEGVLVDLAPADRAAHLQRIYQSNINHMLECNAMLAVVDGRDIGTMFEIGFFTSKRLSEQHKDNLLVTYTDNSFGLNVMIQQSVDAHLKGLGDLASLLKMAKYNEQIGPDQLSFFKDFNQNTF